jgi:hypothetical protein
MILKGRALTDDRAFVRLFAVSRLAATSRALQREVREVRARDVVDWADWFVRLGQTLPSLRIEILEGEYAPGPPTRYEFAKGKGAYRVITVPNMRDVLVYRHISDEALRRALPTKVRGAYFSRRFTSTPIGPTFNLEPGDPYHKFFSIWLAYNTYRSRTLLNSPHDIVVVTDISNYFDSIHHELLLEYLAPLGLPRKAVGLLGRLFDGLRPTAGHSPNPAIGLAQDEFDCSRELAHVFLFEHDRRMAQAVGEDHYVRWMDDQNLGVPSLTAARQTVNELTRSLGSQRLTVNAGKTQFLSPPEVVNHFQLAANQSLDAWNKKFWPLDLRTLPAARAELRRRWREILAGDTVGVGHWDKILKRMYAYAVLVDIPDLESRALSDLVEYPGLDERVFSYFAKRNRARGLIELFKTYVRSGESLFEATESAFFDLALRLAPTGREARDLKALAKRFARGSRRRRTLARASAVVLYYWLGAKPEELRELYAPDEAPRLPKEVARAWLASATSREPTSLAYIQSCLLGHPSDDVARLARFLADLQGGQLAVLPKFGAPKSRWPQSGYYFDARSWLLLEAASHSPNPKVRRIVSRELPRFAATITMYPEKRVHQRIATRLAARVAPPTPAGRVATSL